MHLSLYQQSEIFRCAFLFGVCLGIFYDLFRLLRALGFSSCRAVFMQDIVFSCFCSVLCFLFAQTTVHGRFRLFVITAHLLGFAAYRCSVGVITGRIYKAAGMLYRSLIDALNCIICSSAKSIAKLCSKMNSKRIKSIKKRQNNAKKRGFSLFLSKRKNF